jgi:uncharacterized protein
MAMIGLDQKMAASGVWLLIATWLAPASPALASQMASPATAATASSSGPSFDCAKPSEIEAVICADPKLSAADRRMVELYKLALPGALGTGSNQLSAQRSWLKERDKACAKGAWKSPYKSLQGCVAAEYDERLEALAIAALMIEPKESLGEIGQLAPKAAPFYKMLYDYASIDDPSRRARTIEAELAPIYAAMDADMRQRLQAPPDYSAGTAHDAAASDANFAAFFSISAVLGNDDIGRDLTWPCAVLVKRPGLVVGLGSYFGGAIDGSVPGSDCEDAMPPTREATALSDAAEAAQPPCEGSIRFSTGREYVKLQDAVRLHLTAVWETDKHPAAGAGDDAPDPVERAWRRRYKVEIGKAAAVLEDYYVRYFAVDRTAANRDARSAIDSLISGPFNGCE